MRAEADMHQLKGAVPEFALTEGKKCEAQDSRLLTINKLKYESEELPLQVLKPDDVSYPCLIFKMHVRGTETPVLATIRLESNAKPSNRQFLHTDLRHNFLLHRSIQQVIFTHSLHWLHKTHTLNSQ